LDKASSDGLWSDALSDGGVYFNKLGPELNTVTILRRRAAADEDISDFTPQHRRAVQLYEQRLAAEGLLDFDEMTHRALHILRDSKAVRDLLTARFPNLVVDEYQDLGPVLDALVTTMHAAGMTITAVGDPDQTMFEFQGADPRYLRDLGPRIGCRPVSLTLNYRSGSALVAASRAALGEDRGYTHDPNRTDPGVIDIRPVSGDLDAHATRTAEVVTELLANGLPAEDIAVLYPGQTDLHDLVEEALADVGIAFDNERGRRVPDGPLANMIMACAARRLSGPLPGPTATVSRSQRNPARVSGGGKTPPSVREIAAMWDRLLQETGATGSSDTPRSLARRLLRLLDSPDREQLDDDSQPFWSKLSELLSAGQLATRSRDRRDQQAPAKIANEVATGLTMAELAGGSAPGRVVITTYHSAKGREFSAVILPGLIEGLVPFWFDNRQLTRREMEEARRKFYVAVTRAVDAVVLIPGDHFTAWGYRRRSARSRFVVDIEREIGR
jgi:DNA helicase-2/ATP-dependent DNA helicase PcrA